MAVDPELKWFFEKHHLEPIANDLRDRVLVALFNGRVGTWRSGDLELRIEILRRTFSIQMRTLHARPWRSLDLVLRNGFAVPPGATLRDLLVEIDRRWPPVLD